MNIKKRIGTLRSPISNCLDIFEFQTKRRIIKIFFMRYSDSILYSGKPREYSWKHKNFTKDVKFHLSVQDDYFSLFARGLIKTWETETLSLWTRMARSSDIVIDVGAYFGLFTHSAAMTGSPSLVIAVEPNPATIQKLYESLELNQSVNVFVLNIALSDETGQNMILVPTDRETSSGAQLLDSQLGNTDAGWQFLGKVLTRKLDSILDEKEYSRVTMIKIDAEGYELKVLKGAEKLLTLSKPNLFVEILEYERFLEVKLFLSALGYSEPQALDGDSISLERKDALSDASLARNYLFRR